MSEYDGLNPLKPPPPHMYSDREKFWPICYVI